MSTQSWNVDVDGVTRQIVVDTDEAAQRTAVRVDGRMVTRPLSSDEHERIFTVGSTAYQLKRVLDGTFDLDIAPPQYQPAPAPPSAATLQRAQTATGAAKHTMTRVAVPKKKGFPIFKVIFAIIVSIAGFIGIRYLASAYTYMSVPWKTYTHEDNRFRIKFAGKPERSTEFISTPVGVLRTVQLKTHHARHHYVVEYIDLPFVVPVEKEGPLVEGVLKEIAGKDRVLTSEWSGAALNFIIEVSKKKDWSEGTMRGKIRCEGRRLYIVYAFVPRGESIGWDVGEFLRSLEVG